MIVLQAIRPRRFQNEVFRQDAIALARKTAEDIYGDFAKTTATWKHEVKFSKQYSVGLGSQGWPTSGPGGNLVEVLVGTDDEIYGYVNYGTKPHEIWAGWYTGKSDKRVLAFPSSSTPKTTPNVIGSKQGGSGDVDTFVPFVNHPGTKARNFDKVIAKKWGSIFKGRMVKLVRDFARASGHYAG